MYYVVFQSFFCIQLFSTFFMFQIFLSPAFSGSRFFRVQVFLGPGFSGSMFFRVQVFLGPGPGCRSRVRVQLLEVAPPDDHFSQYFNSPWLSWRKYSNSLNLSKKLEKVEAVIRRCSSKYVFLKICKISQESICVGVSV